MNLDRPSPDKDPGNVEGAVPAADPLHVSRLDDLPPPSAPVVRTPPDSLPAQHHVTLRKKHLLLSRWMHWINFPLLGLMIWSGLLIYWADSDAANLHPHQTYRIGIGSWTLLRFFPDVFYAKLGMPFRLAEGMGWHFFVMWLFGINGILYVLYTFVSGAWRDLVPNRHSFTEAWQVFLHDLHLRKECPPVRKYNGAQQIAYTFIILAGFGSLVTGLAIYKPIQLQWITWLCGGYEFARFLHFWLMIAYVAFFIIHVLQVARAGWNNFRSMVTGYELVQQTPEEQP